MTRKPNSQARAARLTVRAGTRGSYETPQGTGSSPTIRHLPCSYVCHTHIRWCARYQGLTRNPQGCAARSPYASSSPKTGGSNRSRRRGGDLSDEAVVRCVHDVFAGLRFPAPEGGVVSVVYPFAFDQ